MAHIEKAREGKNDWWRYVVVLFLVFILIQLVGSFPLLFTLIQGGVRNFDKGDWYSLAMQAGVSQNMFLMLQLFPFVVAFFMLDYFIPRLHERGFTDTVTGAESFRINHFVKAFLVWFILSIASLVLDYVLHPGMYQLQFQLKPFIGLLLISIIFLPIQTGFEEYLFRGYLLQGFSLLLKNKWMGMLVVSLMFALLHLGNPEVGYLGTGWALTSYISWALLFGIVTILDDGIEAAWGAHTANNLFAALFITHSSSALQTPALFSVTEIDGPESVIALLVMSVIFLAVLWKLLGWKLKKNRISLPD